MMLLSKLAIVCIAGLTLSGLANAASDLPQKQQDSIAQALTDNFPQIKVSNVHQSVFPGVFELVLDNGETVFMNEAGDHLLVNAKLLKVEGPGQIVDVLEKRKSSGRSELIAALDTSKAIVFKGKGENTIPVYIFTDVDCGYCRKLHDEVPALQKAGIDVHYFAWPRAGVKSPTGEKMHQVWCADDQQSAMTAAKSGGSLPKADPNCESPLAEQLQQGLKLGVAGTPAIFTATGQQIGGYATAADLIPLIKPANSDTAAQ